MGAEGLWLYESMVGPGLERRPLTLITHERAVTFKLNDTDLEAVLNVPERSRGLVIFANASGTSRYDGTMRSFAEFLNWGRLSTLLLDLLSVHEEAIDLRTSEFRCSLEVLSSRLLCAMDAVSATGV